MVNQTVSIPNEPDTARYFKKNLIEFVKPTSDECQMLYHSIGMRDSLHQRQRKEAEKLTVRQRELSTEQVEQQTKLWLRIEKQRGVNVQNLVDPEYKPSKQMDKNQKRVTAFKQLDSQFGCALPSAVDAAQAAAQSARHGQQQQLE